MIRIELRSLEKGEILLERSGIPEQVGLDGAPVALRGKLELHCSVALQEEYVLVSGWVKGTMALTCDRCLKFFERDFRTCIELQFKNGPVPGEADGGAADELLYFEGESVDLSDEIRQLLELSVPMRSLCVEDCRGFCGGCGANLNSEKCRCAGPPPDVRWGALKNWKP